MSSVAGTRRRPTASHVVHALEHSFDRVFGVDANPLRQLGALALLTLWIALASGAYLYVVFDTSAAGAHASIADLGRDQPWVGGLVRSLHRYSADAFALLTALHVVREWALGHYAGFRWYSWVSGVPLPWLALGSGLVGYWLVADTRALFVATGLAEWAGWLPGFGDTPIRNFVAVEALSDRLFSLLVFLHIGLALLILGGLWIHLRRIARPLTQPRRPLAIGACSTLLALSIAWPALSTAPADFSQVPLPVPVDWFYFGVIPLMHATSPATVWTLAGAGTLLLLALPWTVRTPRPAAAVVHLDHCNGCGRCFEDCPYSAVVLVARSDGARHAAQARVDADLCASCGICVGACITSTPLRSAAPLATGIDLPGQPIAALQDRVRAGLARHPGALVLFGCDEGADVAMVANAGVVALSLPCSAMLPPSFVEFALNCGARRVIVGSCGDGGCAYRLGGRWTRERMSGQRIPALRARVRGPQVQVVDAARGEEMRLRDAIDLPYPRARGAESTVPGRDHA